MYCTRTLPRVPYEDFMEDSDDIAKDLDDDGFSFSKSYSKKGVFGYSRKQKTPQRVIKKEAIHGQYMTSNDPRCYVDPINKSCRLVPFNVIMDNINDLSVIFKEGEEGVNTLVPNYDQSSSDIMTNFGFPNEVTFSLKDISKMSEETLYDELQKVEENLSQVSPNETIGKDFVIVPPYDENIKESISIQQNVMTFDWKKFGANAQFDVIVMDPPWPISVAATTRGVSLGYDIMEIDQIAAMPIDLVQSNGFLIMWVVASTLADGINMMKKWGYKIVNYGNWIKTSITGQTVPSNGYFLQHCKETYIVGKKGKVLDDFNIKEFEDAILCPRGRQSHKPEKLYEFVEKMFPDGLFLEIFARGHNLREGWVSLGLEVPN